MYNFEESKAFLYSDTPVPDIFVSEYLPGMTGIQVKVYLYCMFLSKNRKKISEMQFAKTFGMTAEEITIIFEELVEKGLFQKKGKGYMLTDLKDKEINKLFKPRTVPENIGLDDKKSIVSAINKGFFQGIMPISWYQNIEMWFNLYKFEDEVMFSLFNYCSDRGLLKYSYVNAVAKAWAEADIKNSFDLDQYFNRHRKVKDISSRIARKLNRKAPFTEYEEKFIRRWVDDFGFDMDMIEAALKRTVKIANPNLDYINKILSDWHKKGYKTPAQAAEGSRQYKAAKNGSDDRTIKTRVKEYYDKIREKNDGVMDARRNEVFTKVPEIKQLLSDISDLSIDTLAMKKSDKQEAFGKIDLMKGMVSELLAKNGFGGDYLEQVYDCEKCSDTGSLPDGSGCSCRKEFIDKIKAG